LRVAHYSSIEERAMDEMTAPKGTGTLFVDLGIGALIVVVLLLAISPATRPLAIGLGIGVPWIVGVVSLLLGMIDQFVKRGSGTGDSDFSSFGPSEERAFVTHEKTMRANGARANLIGFGLAGGLFVLGLLVTGALYTPCTQFCDHPPATCKSDSSVASWRATCESTCSRLESTPGLSLLKGQQGATSMQPVGGTEYVQALGSCSFSNGAGAICEEVVKRATSMGLWCPETN
jgi:hypothetical protein